MRSAGFDRRVLHREYQREIAPKHSKKPRGSSRRSDALPKIRHSATVRACRDSGTTRQASETIVEDVHGRIGRCGQNGWKGGEPYRGCVSRVYSGYT